MAMYARGEMQRLTKELDEEVNMHRQCSYPAFCPTWLCVALQCMPMVLLALRIFASKGSL